MMLDASSSAPSPTLPAIGYKDIELLGSMNNFGMPPARLRAVLDQNGLTAPSTHVSGNALADLDRQLDDALTLGHQYLTVASLPIDGPRTVDDYRRWADRLNEAGRRARERNIWIAFHNHANDFASLGGVVLYDVLLEATDPARRPHAARHGEHRHGRDATRRTT